VERQPNHCSHHGRDRGNISKTRRPHLDSGRSVAAVRPDVVENLASGAFDSRHRLAGGTCRCRRREGAGRYPFQGLIDHPAAFENLQCAHDIRASTSLRAGGHSKIESVVSKVRMIAAHVVSSPEARATGPRRRKRSPPLAKISPRHGNGRPPSGSVVNNGISVRDTASRTLLPPCAPPPGDRCRDSLRQCGFME